MENMDYKVKKSETDFELTGEWNGSIWQTAGTIEVNNFRPEGSGHKPVTKAKLLYTAKYLYGIFNVHDQYVKCTHTGLNAPVYKDSCVEFFFVSNGTDKYFNFEFNCGGTVYCSYRKSKYEEAEYLTAEDYASIDIYHSLPEKIEIEIDTPVDWILEFKIPIDLLKKYNPAIKLAPGSEWRGNFYKCGDETSHPHWASWAPIDRLNFHLPECFGKVGF